jgi:hypothetical protein
MEPIHAITGQLVRKRLTFSDGGLRNEWYEAKRAKVFAMSHVAMELLFVFRWVSR